ncbi:hypothetical protein [Pseudomonas putida]|uniref:Uncharacterized protein n=1 Tax=Pseudomonas putida TaxID=303 RepID=A0A177SUC9_PSEPU|nr:hypothetical protein [Pseudomonas putida]OAI93930.1 hypothetical protein AYO28_10585 [Pseudomonas putida]
MSDSNPFPALIEYFAAKRAMLQQDSPVLTSIALGSSHGDFAFDPRYSPGSFNLCSRSQDFRHALALYQHAVNQAPRLDTVIVFYSLFSPGNLLEQSPSEKILAPLMNEIFQLGLSYEDPLLTQIASQLQGRLAAPCDSLGGVAGFLPDQQKAFMPASQGAAQRVADHMRLNAREDGNQYLAQLLLLAAELRHRVIVVIPPMHEAYRAAAGHDSAFLFRGVFELQQLLGTLAPGLDMQIIDLYADPAFHAGHFGDFDHLLPQGEGAMLLSRRIGQALGAA